MTHAAEAINKTTNGTGTNGSDLLSRFKKTNPFVFPHPPESLEDTGISKSFLSNLIAKHLYCFGELTGLAIAEKLCLPFPILDQILDEIVFNKLAEKRGGRGMGNATDIFASTDRGRKHSRELMEGDTYTGPAPVPLDQYTAFVKEKTIRSIGVNEPMLREAWQKFVIDDELFRLIGPAMCSGRSCFLYGPPGTGKTTLAKAMAQFYDKHGGYVAVPHAVLVGGSVIRVYDPVYHETIAIEDEGESPGWLRDSHGDKRWKLCHRPVVTVGGELTLDMLDLRYNPTTRYYEAPLQMKANGGVFVIDDFGRQLVSPRDLLNRWIVPLEEHIDYLTLHTGKKFTVPFEELVVFATNLDPEDLADEAFLRRIRYKIFVGELSPKAYKMVFDNECRKKGLQYDDGMLMAFIQHYYCEQNHIMRACDPRDFTDAALDTISFDGLPKEITLPLLKSIAEHSASLVKT